MPDPSPENDVVLPTDGQIVVGTVIGTHGYEGRLRVTPETDNPDRYAQGAKLTIAEQEYTVQRSGPGPGGIVLLVKLAGVDTLGQATELVHQPIVVEATDAPELPEGTYYHFQLIDIQVVDTAGAPLGKLTEVIATGANDVYVVTNESSEIMVPALANVVLEINLKTATMTVDIPEGIQPRTLNTPKKKRPIRRRPPKRRPTNDPT
jgi:16S rRNA processing protein RimM